MNTQETIEYSDYLKRLSRQIANSANRLEQLLDAGAPVEIVEGERKILVGRIAAFPIAEIAKQE